jgi:hypothetical protein
VSRKKPKKCLAFDDTYGKCYEAPEYPIESCRNGKPASIHYKTIMSSEPYGPVWNNTVFKPHDFYPTFYNYEIPLNIRQADALAHVAFLRQNEFLGYDTYTFELGVPTYQPTSGMGVQAWLRFTFPNDSPGEMGLYSWSGRIFHYDRPGDVFRAVLEVVFILFTLRLLAVEVSEWRSSCLRTKGSCSKRFCFHLTSD